MVSKVFILGRTGSGKSTASRMLADMAQQCGWSVEAFNDYPFLREMYVTNPGKRFRSTDYNGFEVLDLSVYDEAISRLLLNVQDYRPQTDKTLLTIEFTSNNYAHTLERFDEELMQGANFMFIAADLKTCIERVNRRTIHPITKDDYYVLETVLLHHYPCPYMPPYVNGGKVMFMNNMGTLHELRCSINSRTLRLLEHDEKKSHLFTFV